MLGAKVSERGTDRAIVSCFVISLVALFVTLPAIDPFTFDSWSTLELARSVGHDFFRANTAREYSSGSAYSSAFPPVWPLVVSFFSLAIGNIYATYLAAIASYVAFAVAAEWLGRRVFASRWVGLASAIVLLRYVGVRSELGGGRSIPLYLCELAVVATLLHDVKSASARGVFLLGLAAGAMSMTRFDAMPATVMTVVAAWWLGVRDARIGAVLAGVVLAVSPWIAYSLAHFDTVFATDNRLVALALDPNAFVLDYHVRPPRLLFDDPRAWIGKVLRNVHPIATEFGKALIESFYLPGLLLFGCAVLLRARARTVQARSSGHARLAIALILIALAPIAGNLMTGYAERRYFSAAVWVFAFLLIGFVARGLGDAGRSFIGVLALVATLLNVGVLRHARGSNPVSAVHEVLSTSAIDSLTLCLKRAGATPTDAVLFVENWPVDPVKFGALTRWRTLPLPSNWTALSLADHMSFLRAYRVQYVAGIPSASEPFLGEERDRFACAVPLRRTFLAGS